MRKSVSYEKLKLEDLKDPEYAREYLRAEIEEFYKDGNERAFLNGLKDVVTAQKGMTRLAKDINRNRQSLYKALSDEGNPSFVMVMDVLGSLGFRVSIERVNVKVNEK